MLLKKLKYVINVLLYVLWYCNEEWLILVLEIVEGENILYKFLEVILFDLKNVGFLCSKCGWKGGYFFKVVLEEISLVWVMCLFDGLIVMLFCVFFNYYECCEECKDEKICGIWVVFLIICD